MLSPLQLLLHKVIQLVDQSKSVMDDNRILNVWSLFTLFTSSCISPQLYSSFQENFLNFLDLVVNTHFLVQRLLCFLLDSDKNSFIVSQILLSSSYISTFLHFAMSHVQLFCNKLVVLTQFLEKFIDINIMNLKTCYFQHLVNVIVKLFHFSKQLRSN